MRKKLKNLKRNVEAYTGAVWHTGCCLCCCSCFSFFSSNAAILDVTSISDKNNLIFKQRGRSLRGERKVFFRHSRAREKCKNKMVSSFSNGTKKKGRSKMVQNWSQSSCFCCQGRIFVPEIQSLNSMTLYLLFPEPFLWVQLITKP